MAFLIWMEQASNDGVHHYRIHVGRKDGGGAQVFVSILNSDADAFPSIGADLAVGTKTKASSPRNPLWLNMRSSGPLQMPQICMFSGLMHLRL